MALRQAFCSIVPPFTLADTFFASSYHLSPLQARHFHHPTTPQPCRHIFSPSYHSSPLQARLLHRPTTSHPCRHTFCTILPFLSLAGTSFALSYPLHLCMHVFCTILPLFTFAGMSDEVVQEVVLMLASNVLSDLKAHHPVPAPSQP